MASLKLLGLSGAVPSAPKAWNGAACHFDGCQLVRRCGCRICELLRWPRPAPSFLSLAGAEPHERVSNFARSMGKPQRGHRRILSINGGQSQSCSPCKSGKLITARCTKCAVRTLRKCLCIHSLTCRRASRRKQPQHSQHKHKAWLSSAPQQGWRTPGWRARHAAVASPPARKRSPTTSSTK